MRPCFPGCSVTASADAATVSFVLPPFQGLVVVCVATGGHASLTPVCTVHALSWHSATLLLSLSASPLFSWRYAPCGSAREAKRGIEVHRRNPDYRFWQHNEKNVTFFSQWN